jgi:hypothetical protein
MNRMRFQMNKKYYTVMTQANLHASVMLDEHTSEARGLEQSTHDTQAHTTPAKFGSKDRVYKIKEKNPRKTKQIKQITCEKKRKKKASREQQTHLG